MQLTSMTITCKRNSTLMMQLQHSNASCMYVRIEVDKEIRVQNTPAATAASSHQ
jgi:hypothetical protein